MSQFVSVAKITRTHGIRGEVTAILLTDFPDRFRLLRKVHLYSDAVSGWEEIERYRFHKDRVILKFTGRERPHEVNDLLGCDVQIPESDRIELPADTYFDSDLLNCQVFDGERSIGKVVDLLKAGADCVNLVIETSDGREIMVPLVNAFVRQVDVGAARISVELPPGLEELSAERTVLTKDQKRKGKRTP